MCRRGCLSIIETTRVSGTDMRPSIVFRFLYHPVCCGLKSSLLRRNWQTRWCPISLVCRCQFACNHRSRWGRGIRPVGVAFRGAHWDGRHIRNFGGEGTAITISIHHHHHQQTTSPHSSTLSCRVLSTYEMPPFCLCCMLQQGASQSQVL